MLLTVCLSSVYIWTDTEHGRQIARLFVLGESGSEHVQYEQRKHDFEGRTDYLFDKKYDSQGGFDYLFNNNMILRVGSKTYLTVSWKL